MSFKVKDHYDLRKICMLTMTWFCMKSEKVRVLNASQSWRSLRLDNIFKLTITWFFFYKERKSSCLECHSQFKITTTWKTYSGWPWHDFLWRVKKFMWWMSFKVEDHYDLRKHLHVDHNMIFYEEQKSSCDECHSKLKTTTTWENTCTLTITWFYMRSEKVHVLSVIQSWRPRRLEKTHPHWP